MFAGIAGTLDAAALSLTLSVPQAAHEVEIGTAVFFNTQQQMERRLK